MLTDELIAATDALVGPDDDEPGLDSLLATVYERYHYDFRDYARSSLVRRMRTAMARLQVPTIEDLRVRIAVDGELFGQLLAFFTVQLSEMFRDPAFFRVFREEVVPVLRTYASRKLWVAGCSTGEEAYSYAVILAEEGLLERTQIYATDIYERSLHTARAGVYDLERMQQFGENYRLAGGTGQLASYYTTGPTGGAMLSRALRDHIVFADHSLTTDKVFAEVEVVSCRNVLIYFSKPLQDRVLALFSDSLVRGGFLGLGPRETVDMTPVRELYAAMPEKWFRKRAKIAKSVNVGIAGKEYR